MPHPAYHSRLQSTVLFIVPLESEQTWSGQRQGQLTCQLKGTLASQFAVTTELCNHSEGVNLMYTASLERNLSNVVLQHAMNWSCSMWLQARDLYAGSFPSTAGKDEEIEGWPLRLLLQGIRPRFGGQPISARGHLRMRRKVGRRGLREVKRSMTEGEQRGKIE